MDKKILAEVERLYSTANTMLQLATGLKKSLAGQKLARLPKGKDIITKRMKSALKTPLTILTIFLISCSKGQLIEERCASVKLISEKYNLDSILLKTDTLWKDDNLCGRWLDTIYKQKTYWLTLCVNGKPAILEKRFYTIKKLP